MNLLGYRAFSTELLKIATEVRDADIRAMMAEARGKEYLNGGALRANSEAETNFKPKLASTDIERSQNMTAHIERRRVGTYAPHGIAAGALAGLPLAGTIGDTLHRSGHGNLAQFAGGAAGLLGATALGGLIGRKFPRHRTDIILEPMEKLAAGFMGYTPPSAYNFRGKKPTGQGSPYETASNFAATGLKGAMTGAGAGTLLHSLKGHEFRMPPKHLGSWVAGGAGIALADRALRRRSVMKQMQKQAMFSPARQLHATQSQGSFENKVHNTPLKPPAATIGRDFRLPPQGA